MKMQKDQRDYTYLQKIIREEMKPFKEILEKHESTLYGKDFRGGIVADVNMFKNFIQMTKLTIGFLGGITGISYLIKLFFGKHA
jgi:hypothetical protein